MDRGTLIMLAQVRPALGAVDTNPFLHEALASSPAEARPAVPAFSNIRKRSFKRASPPRAAHPIQGTAVYAQTIARLLHWGPACPGCCSAPAPGNLDAQARSLTGLELECRWTHLRAMAGAAPDSGIDAPGA